MALVAPCLADVNWICHHLRDWDRKEIFAARWSDDPDDMAIDTMTWLRGQYVFVARNRDTEMPVALVGARQRWPGVWSPWMFATDDFGAIALPLTRWCKTRMIPELKSLGMRRADCMSIEGHDEAHRWMTMLGAKMLPQPYTNYGKDGETFYCFVWE